MNDADTARPEKARVFLSYAREDKAIARHIADSLKRSGVSAWFDEWELALGDSIANRIGTAVASSDFVLVLLSPASVASNWIQQEWSAALSTELNDRAIRVVPVLIADCEIPPLLASRLYLDLRHDIDAGVQRLVAQLSAVPAIQFSHLGPQEFERLVADLLAELGFSVEVHTSRGRDLGYDFIALYKSRDPFDVEIKEQWIVQVKLYRNSRVSISVLREMSALLGDSRANKALVVTSGNITSEGRRFLAESRYGNRIRVIEGPELMSLIARHPALIERHFPRGGSRA